MFTVTFYFAFELLVHVVFPPSDVLELKDRADIHATDLAFHELFELLLIGFVFVIFRARLNEPFYDFDIEEDIERIADIEFIVINTSRKSSLAEADIVVVIPPKKNRYIIGVAKQTRQDSAGSIELDSI